MNTPAPLNLPTVAHVDAMPDRAARLTLEDGQAVTIPATADRLALSPTVRGHAVMLEGWGLPTCRAYHVPAHLCAAVSAALNLRRVGT